MKIAAIGAGAWGKNIVRTLAEMGSLVAVAEASPQLRASLQQQYPNLEVVEDFETLAHRLDIDAVTIATPAATHFSIANRFLDAGKDVFVEKPMTLAVAESEALLKKAADTGRILMVGHLLLYKPAIGFIRNFIRTGGLGRVFTLHQERAKLGKARSVENALWSLGVHDVAALLYLVGCPPTAVSCHGHRGLQEGVEDDTYLHMTFEDGSKAHLHNSWLWPEDRRGLVIVGEKGMIIYDEKTERVTLVKKSIDRTLNNVDEGAEVIFEAPRDFQPLRAELEHFVECLQTRQTPRSCGQNGLDVVRVLEAAA